MKSYIFIILIVLKLTTVASQNLTEPDIIEIVKTYKEKFTTPAWEYNKPLILFVIDCSKQDKLYFSVTALKQQWQFEYSKITHYYKTDDEYILIRLDSGCNEQVGYFIPISTVDSLSLKNKLISDKISLSSVAETLIYSKKTNDRPQLLEVVKDYNVSRKYRYLLP